MENRATLPYYVLDVFSNKSYQGNPLSVVFTNGDLALETYQNISKEFGYSETSFVYYSTKQKALNVKGLKEIFGKEFETIAKEQIVLIKEISGHIEGINSKVLAMTNERKKANQLTDAQKMAEAYCNNVKPYFGDIRNHCDKLELLVDDETWTLTKYRELLFTK